MREKTLDKERLMDRAALKLALKRMMWIMGAPEIQKTSSLTKEEKSPSQINMTKSKVLSEFTEQLQNICSLKRHAIVSRNCRDDIEFSKRKEDLNLMVEKMLHPYNNECECNLKFSSHATLNKSITVQIDNPQNVLNSKKFSWWKRTKNKIRKKKNKKMTPYGGKTASV
ncbi:uncharacterized protein LOC127280762 [Leptopilina boulardi]|uniref:uncharacterized protein LOC127280762 n=1 Tax=Leptopilina boulardi TaxID=63433 RepID=UPI0021F5A375|nr:uncharacterized protein LOC127280762 [Leptopilina boulardi]